MVKILITGSNSYIGTSFEKWLAQWPDDYKVDTVDMIDGSWKNKDFSQYDVLFHVAGIAHSDTGKVTDEKKAFYYKINTDLTIETAKKAKTDGVKQFIFMSSAIIYGDSAPIGKQKIINRETIPSPANFYGDSKLQAENGILPLQNDNFKVVILRPPMIYGKGSKGNYPTLVKYSCKLPVFPNIENKRSMLYISNLTEFIRLMIDNNERGIFFPQNDEYVKTAEMVKLIAEAHHKIIRLIKLFNPLLRILGVKFSLVNKAFGNFCYEKSISEYKVNYRIYNLKDSIIRTEN